MTPRKFLTVVGAGGLLALVVGAPAAASWQGLTAAGRDSLGLTGPSAALVPLVLDAAALFAAVLSLRDVLAGDTAIGNRVLVWAYALGSAGMNLWHADRTHGLAAGLFFAAASVSAVVLWDRTLRAARRSHLREAGAMPSPTPRFRPARWVVAPGETARAWRLAVIEGVTDPTEAVALTRHDQSPEVPRITVAAERADELDGLTKADAVRAAVGDLMTPDGEQPGPTEVVAWLAERGVPVGPSYVTDVRRRDQRRAAAIAPADTDRGPGLRLAK